MEILEQLPERVTALELQIVQLRNEMRADFSATRAEARAGHEETRRGLRDEIRTGDEETRRTLQDEIRTGDEETRRVLTTDMHELFATNERHIRLLHEDLVGRIAMLAEGR